MVRLLTALLLSSATLVAEISTRVLDVTTGAMNKPPPVMVPELAVQATADLLVFLTVAVNCCFEPEAKTAELGAIEIEVLSCVSADFMGVPLVDVPPQPTEIMAAKISRSMANSLA
jgi:hypothetical protein